MLIQRIVVPVKASAHLYKLPVLQFYYATI